MSSPEQNFGPKLGDMRGRDGFEVPKSLIDYASSLISVTGEKGEREFTPVGQRIAGLEYALRTAKSGAEATAALIKAHAAEIVSDADYQAMLSYLPEVTQEENLKILVKAIQELVKEEKYYEAGKLAEKLTDPKYRADFTNAINILKERAKPGSTKPKTKQK